MDARCLPVLGMVVAMAACDAPAGPRRAIFPREAMPVGSACTHDAIPAARFGIEVVPPSRRASPTVLTLKNAGAAPHDVRALFVVRDQGSCTSILGRSTGPLELVDKATCSPPATTELAPSASMELTVQQGYLDTIDPHCEKVALALWIDVDGQRACADAGAWVLSRTED